MGEKDEAIWQGLAERFISAVEMGAMALSRIADALQGKGPSKVSLIFGAVSQSQKEENK